MSQLGLLVSGSKSREGDTLITSAKQVISNYKVETKSGIFRL